MATRAVYSFIGFANQPTLHLYLHHDGYPTGAAWRFCEALRLHSPAPQFLAAFVQSQSAALPLASPCDAADADYRYQLELLAGGEPRIVVCCWRRLPASNSWSPRCEPLLLSAFIQRFLPGDGQGEAAQATGDTPQAPCCLIETTVQLMTHITP